jgi:hypothetical protein
MVLFCPGKSFKIPTYRLPKFRRSSDGILWTTSLEIIYHILHGLESLFHEFLHRISYEGGLITTRFNFCYNFLCFTNLSHLIEKRYDGIKKNF